MKYLIVNQPCGRLGNVLANFAHYYCAAMHYGYRLVDFTFARYQGSFELSTKRINCIKIAKKNGSYYRVYSWLRSLKVIETIATGIEGTVSPDQELSLDRILDKRHKKWDFIELVGWGIRANDLVWKYQDILRKDLSPLRGVIERCTPFIEQLKWRGKRVVGIHVRLGDYKEFQGGQYYIPPEMYNGIIEQLYHLMGAGNVEIIIFSDQIKMVSRFITHPVHLSSYGEVEDLWLMSQCDQLIGPISSFSVWASFMGKVPLCRITPLNTMIELEPSTYYLPGGFAAKKVTSSAVDDY